MNRNHNPALRSNAQRLRRNMTKEERRLWFGFLKELPITFNRQKVMGNYIVDFYCASARLVVELDGSQHYEEAGEAADSERDAWLSDQRIRVLRFPTQMSICLSRQCVRKYSNTHIIPELKTNGLLYLSALRLSHPAENVL